MTNNLLPCPFCTDNDLFVGGEDFESLDSANDTEMKFIHCVNCNAHGPYECTEQKAIKAWNKRNNNG